MRFELLRTYPVDLLRYLPKFLKNDPSFKATQDALSVEHEKIRLLLIDVCKQLFVESATWGLADWERVYAITPAKGALIEERRKILLAKIQGSVTITAEQLETLINYVIPTKDGRVYENTAPNQFKIGMNTPIAIDEVRRTVETYKPAHLSYQVFHNFVANAPMKVAGAVRVLKNIKLEQIKSDNTITTHTNGVVVGAVAVSSVYTLKGGTE